MHRKFFLLSLHPLYIITMAVLLCCAPAHASYDYPVKNRFEATIIGTPDEFSAALPEHIPVKTYTLPSLKAVPDVFWHQDGLAFSVALQKKRAPLIFLIAGTGAAYNSSKMETLQKALYGAGFSVINITSPTHFNFIVNASSSGLTGYLPDDTADLYRVMQQAWEQVRDDADVSEFSVGGYSLGGTTAAFLARYDEQVRSFNFRKVLMINPSVNLYNSVKLLDSYLVDNIKPGQGEAFLDEAIQDIAVAYDPKKGMNLDSDIFYRAYRINHEKKAALLDGGDRSAAALIGLGFRISSSAMLFSGDVMSKSGYITPAGKTFGRTDALDYYAWASSQIPFTQYVDDLLIPALMKKHPDLSREQLLKNASLNSLDDYIRHSNKIYGMTNADEIILAPGEIDYLRSLLGSRLTVYPHGGHCGNIAYRDNVRDIIAVFHGDQP